APWFVNVSPVDPQDLENENPMDIYDNHGLFVSGIIGYTAPNATILVKNILTELGAVDDADLAQTIDQYLTGHPDVHLVNLSLGGPTMNAQPRLALQTFVDQIVNVVFAASAGNPGSAPQPFYPAALPQVVGVGALNQDDEPAPFSNSSPSS